MASLNAGPEFYAAQARLGNAKTYEEKMAALEEMLRQCPKHKGSQGVLFEIRDKMARLRREKESEAKKKAARKSGGDFVRKQGGAQVVLVGFANAGKTALLNSLTGLHAPSTSAPFETTSAIPGMMDFNKVQVQVIDTPSITEANKARIFALARNADLAVAVIDPLMEAEQRQFFNYNLPIFLKGVKILVIKRSTDYDIKHAGSIEAMKKRIFEALDVIRVFTKAPREKAEMSKPIVLKRGSNVAEVAKQIHKEFARELDHAKVWGSSRFQGQRVGPDYILGDGDIVELHLKQEKSKE